MLIGQYQDLAARVTANEACCNATSAQLAIFDTEINSLVDAANNATLDATTATLAEIRDNGLRFGDNWWIGNQGDYFFFIDIVASSYYLMNPGVNVTLS